MDQHQFYYQPSPIYSTIDWCWTFIVLLTGIIFWLEVTHVQWITICFFVAFFFIAGAELFNRRLIVNGSTLIIRDVFGRQWRKFNLQSGVKRISFTKHTVTIVKFGRKYQFSLLANDIDELRKIIQTVVK